MSIVTGMSEMLLTRALECIAEDTWNLLEYAHGHRSPLSEDTITEINLLRLKSAQLPGMKIRRVPSRQEEARTGIDWEWWIGTDGFGWLRYAVQAKKLYADGRYRCLKHPVHGRQQMDILADYSNIKNAIPLYCFYNFQLSRDGPKPNEQCGQCGIGCSKEQFGCTIVPLHVVREAAASFDAIHSSPCALPWRCLVRCPRIIRVITEAKLARERGGDPQQPLDYDLPGIELENDSLGARKVWPFEIPEIFPTIPGEIAAIFSAEEDDSIGDIPLKWPVIPRRFLKLDLRGQL